jgi:phage terminase small subunit
MALTEKREKFAQAVASGKNSTDAYREAFTVNTMSDKTLWSKASAMYATDAVRARIDELREIREQGTHKLFSMTKAEAAALVLQDAKEVMEADAAELITHRRLNCRYCHGVGHEYRWRDEAEFWGELARVSQIIEGWNVKRGRPPELPTDSGGYGFRRLAPPDPRCPQCEGEGIADVFVADIRTLSGAARRAYAGVEVKKDGSIKMLTRDKSAAAALLAKYAGIAGDTLTVGGVLGLTPVPQMTPEQATAVAKALDNKI